MTGVRKIALIERARIAVHAVYLSSLRTNNVIPKTTLRQTVALGAVRRSRNDNDARGVGAALPVTVGKDDICITKYSEAPILPSFIFRAKWCGRERES